MGSVPLLTCCWPPSTDSSRSGSAVVGAVVALGGIALMSSGAISGDVSIASVLAIVVAAAAASESGIVLEWLPHAHPVATNAIGMSIGAILLLSLSLVAGEHGVADEHERLGGRRVPGGGLPFLFMLLVYVIRRWSATGASYQFVLFPIVAVIGGALCSANPSRPLSCSAPGRADGCVHRSPVGNASTCGRSRTSSAEPV